MNSLLFFERIGDREQDLDNLLQLKSEPDDVYWSGYKSLPEKSNFREWFNKQLTRNDRIIWLVYQNYNHGEAVGYLYVTLETAHNKKIALVSHGVTQREKGKGIGTLIVNFALNSFESGFFGAEEIQAWVLSENIASIKTFLANGFQKSDLFQNRFYDSMKRDVRLDNYFRKKK